MFKKELRSERGSALIITIITIAVLGIVVASTTTSSVRGFKEKKSTLSSERTEYVSNACSECVEAYINKLVNTANMYILYNASEDYKDTYKTMNGGTEYPDDAGGNSPFGDDDKEDFNGAIIQFNPFLYYDEDNPDPYRKPQITDAKFYIWNEDLTSIDETLAPPDDATESEYLAWFGDTSDPDGPGAYNEAKRNWKENMIKYAVNQYEEHISGKYNGSNESIYGKKIKDEINLVLTGIVSGLEDEGIDVESITAEIIAANEAEEEKNFVEDDYVKIRFTSVLPHDNTYKTIVQTVEYRWNSHEMLEKACKDYAGGGFFSENVKVEKITKR